MSRASDKGGGTITDISLQKTAKTASKGRAKERTEASRQDGPGGFDGSGLTGLFA
jgi:hypothetical protein